MHPEIFKLSGQRSFPLIQGNRLPVHPYSGGDREAIIISENRVCYEGEVMMHDGSTEMKAFISVKELGELLGLKKKQFMISI